MIHPDERGQALAFGAVLLVSLAVGMYLIADFGNHVRQKVHVQTVADATAYSLATMEAQSFNFVAFCNRAQVTHYVTMLNVQALVSWASWMEHSLVITSNVTYWLAKIPYLGALESVSAAMWAPVPLLTGALDALEPIQAGAESALYTMNRVLWVAQMTLANVVAVNLATGGFDLLQQIKHDPRWNPDMTVNTLLAAWNTTKYAEAFSGAGGGPLKWTSSLSGAHANDATVDSETARLQKAMTEVVNATRFNKTLVNRPPIPITGIIEANGWIQDALNTPGVGSVVKATFGVAKIKLSSKSASRLVGIPQGDTIAQIFASEADDQNNRGQTMSSHDEWLWGEGGVWASAANNGTSSHCRAVKGAIRGESPITIVKNWLLECRDQAADTNHTWKGIAPYMSLAAMRTSDGAVSNFLVGDKFRQPDVYVWLSKKNEEAGFGKGIKIDWQVGNDKARMETAYGHTLPTQLAALGIHATSHAQAYYHRPGNWQEPPNLWNPYWHARLMPILPGLQWNNGSNPMETFLKNMMPALPVVYH